MKLKIVHKTNYSYSGEVFFEPHYLRFKPKLTTFSSVEDFCINVEPKPSGITEQFDPENNHLFLCWFEKTHKNMGLEVNIQVNIQDFNPFAFLVHPLDYLRLPFRYDSKLKQVLKPALKTSSLYEPMNQFVQNVLFETNYETIPFLTNLTRQIHQNFIVESRETGEPHKPEYTFMKKKGSCRDLAWMQIHLLRNLGIASRFVSGYLYLQGNTSKFELHAWLEVYLPGAGWIGFDPSHGLLADKFHIPVASSVYYSNTMPVSGTIRGSAKHKLTNQLTITLIT